MRSAISSRCLGIALILLTAAVVSAQTGKCQQTPLRKISLDGKGAFLDINNIELAISNIGNIAYDPDNGGFQGLYYPAGQREKSVLYTGGLWLVGEVNGGIRSASVQYSSEYRPGPILADGTAGDPGSSGALYTFDAYSPPTSEAVALGCPDEVMGDQMLFTVYNDLGSHANLNNTEPLGVEVQQTTWGYDVEGALANVAFTRLRIINKGGNQINNAYLAMWYDPDIGDSNDDAMGADSVLGLIFDYNGDDYDNRYGTQIPTFASDFFQGPIVDTPGENAVLNDGTELANKKILGQTAAFHFV